MNELTRQISELENDERILAQDTSALSEELESAMALTNRGLDPDLETVFLLPDPEHAHVSSTLVRQIARLGGDVSALVPGPVAEALRQRFPPSTS